MDSLIDSSDFDEFEEEYFSDFFISTFTYLKKFVLYTRKWLKKGNIVFLEILYNLRSV